MRIGSLCSGAGGLDMAVERVFGAETVWHCEYNPAASKVLAHRYLGIPNHHDVTTTDWDTVEPVDIITAGYPCQPFSVAGKRKGTNDERHIWPDVREAIRRIRPRYTILENVSGHRSMGFDRVLGDLAEDGMHVAWTSLRASDVGAPHQRERLFILATDAQRGDSRQSHGHPTIGRRTDDTEQTWLGDSGTDGLALLPTPTARDRKGTGPSEINRKSPSMAAIGALLLLPTPAASDGRRGQDYARASREGSGGDDLVTAAVKATNTSNWGKYAPAIERWEAVTRPAPEPTEPNTKGNPRLAPAFSEWMMGWPAGWVTDAPDVSRNDQLRIIGNGVCPQQAHAAILRLLTISGVVL